MGRHKKIVDLDPDVIKEISVDEKLRIINLAQQIIAYEAAQIKQFILPMTCSDKPEVIAKRFYEVQGFTVYTSKIKDGYRCIGTELFWKSYKEELSDYSKEIIKTLKQALAPSDFLELVKAIKDKNGTPDLLLIKDNKVSFVEVKSKNETIKESTIVFFLKYKHQWPLEILRIVDDQQK